MDKDIGKQATTMVSMHAVPQGSTR
jgi:hypothetical protein